MGNEQSNLSGLEIDDKAIEVTDYWTHHSATISSGNQNTVSILIGEPLANGSLWTSQTPLEKSVKNLMLYRHPCILRYISSWHKNSKFYAVTEDVRPLSHVLSLQNTLQLCVGLYSILKALCFLHEKASASHNNVCIASVYVTSDGNWRLGGMEYLCKFKDITAEYLSKTRAHRYNKGVDPNESKINQETNDLFVTIDTYAFGVFVNDVLRIKTDEEISSLISFRDLCKNELQNTIITSRPKLFTLLEHQFFNHDFITVYSFLTELPLKSDTEKTQFFTGLANRLRAFSESVVACQLGGLLLSRIVLLDKTAQTEFIPYVLSVRQDKDETSGGLFSINSFKKHMVPRLLQIFCVRDAQIRLLLLDHFVHYKTCFSMEELKTHVLPELLVGIKDTNDHLVAVTLHALADLVPILGATTVIGGKRAKLFNDGRPIVHLTRKSRRNSRHPSDSPRASTNFVHVTQVQDSESLSSNGSRVDVNQMLELPERPSPDGEEGETSTDEIEQSVEEDLDNWEDWDIHEESGSNTNNNSAVSDVPNINSPARNSSSSNQERLANNLNSLTTYSELNTGVSSQDLQTQILDMNTESQVTCLPDILRLDIKNQVGNSLNSEEYDFFQGMEPVIETPSKFIVPVNDVHQPNFVYNNKQEGVKKLNLGVTESEIHEEGWGEDSDWY